MTEKEIALEAVWSEAKKVICCNSHTGEIVFLKELPADEDESCRQAKTIDEYARRMVASGLIHKQDAESFLKHVDLHYVRTELQRTNGVLVHSYRRNAGTVISGIPLRPSGRGQSARRRNGSYSWEGLPIRIPVPC